MGDHLFFCCIKKTKTYIENNFFISDRQLKKYEKKHWYNAKQMIRATILWLFDFRPGCTTALSNMSCRHESQTRFSITCFCCKRWHREIAWFHLLRDTAWERDCKSRHAVRQRKGQRERSRIESLVAYRKLLLQVYMFWVRQDWCVQGQWSSNQILLWEMIQEHLRGRAWQEAGWAVDTIDLNGKKDRIVSFIFQEAGMKWQLVTWEYSFKFIVDKKTGEKTCLITYPPICRKYHINQIRLYCKEALQLVEDIADIQWYRSGRVKVPGGSVRSGAYGVVFYNSHNNTWKQNTHWMISTISQDETGEVTSTGRDHTTTSHTSGDRGARCERGSAERGTSWVAELYLLNGNNGKTTRSRVIQARVFQITTRQCVKSGKGQVWHRKGQGDPWSDR